MNTRRAILVTTTILLLLAFTIPASSKPNVSIIVNNADTVRQESFSMTPDLTSLFASVAPRIIVQYANHLREITFVNIPGALGTLLSQVQNRIIIQYANNNREEFLTYPIEFFNDSTPPKISNVAAQGMGIITWKTDEYATSTVIYGTNTVGEITNPLYTKQHQVTLTGLTPGVTYKYKVRSTDRSGNTSTSNEYSFTPQVSLSTYLPFIMGTR